MADPNSSDNKAINVLNFSEALSRSVNSGIISREQAGLVLKKYLRDLGLLEEQKFTPVKPKKT